MKNITVTVPDELHLHARLCAAHRNTTVTELVRGFIMGLETVPGRRASARKAALLADQNLTNTGKLYPYPQKIE